MPWLRSKRRGLCKALPLALGVLRVLNVTAHLRLSGTGTLQDLWTARSIVSCASTRPGGVPRTSPGVDTGIDRACFA